jgi:hypothetical protein
MRLATGLWTYAEHQVDLRGGQRPVGGRYRAENLGVELDLVESDTVVDAQIKILLAHRVHLRSAPIPAIYEATRRVSGGT